MLQTICGRRGSRRNNTQGDDLNSKKPKQQPTTSIPLLSFLPTQQDRRPLTPPSTSSQPQPEHLAALGTLARLPPELRRRILLYSFGNRTLHLDLRLTHARLAGTQPSLGAVYAHDGMSAPLARSPDEDLPREWRWWSSECHRSYPAPPGSCPAGEYGYFFPHRDACIRGRASFCQRWNSLPVAEGGSRCCCIGAMGWLRACRLAYVEGIDVLYATNTFFIESPDLLSALLNPPSLGPEPCFGTGSGIVERGYLIRPESLARITALELRWEVLLFGRMGEAGWDYEPRQHEVQHDRRTLAAHLSGLALGTPFTGLMSLVLSFTDHLYHDQQVRPDGARDEIERVLLRPIAEAAACVRPNKAVRENYVVVELPQNVFRDLMGDMGAQGLGLEREERGQGWSDEKGVWLKYPISSTGGKEEFFYIKEGMESKLVWEPDLVVHF